MGHFWRRQHRRSVRATWRTFGIGRELAEVALRDPVWRAATQISLALDGVLFPAWRDSVIDKPVFIVGHPRSGTTMLHRCLTQTDEFVVFQFWHILFPALTARRLVGPVVRARVKAGKDVLVPKEVGHEFALGEVDEEELLFVFQALTQFYPVLSGLAFDEEDFDEIVYSDDLPESIRRASMAWLDGCLRRQVLFTGRMRVVAKMNYSAMRIRTLLEQYPDARIVYLVRSPLDTIPSHQSLHHNVIEYRHQRHPVPPAVLERYLRRRYAHNVSFCRHMEDVLTSGDLSKAQVLVVRYDDMMADLERVVAEVAAFADLTLSQETRRAVA